MVKGLNFGHNVYGTIDVTVYPRKQWKDMIDEGYINYAIARDNLHRSMCERDELI